MHLLVKHRDTIPNNTSPPSFMEKAIQIKFCASPTRQTWFKLTDKQLNT